ncbi:MAG TPA: RDD family protein [Steroidobacteraceae bacterium]|jgi:uncharacterized RDD family membrane protein YckC|nr:RDD family protein [Steroidobacteraceae bacterium]
MPDSPGGQSTSGERLRLESATGVDLTLTVAGPGSRSYAFLIDWHIRLLAAAIWLLIATYAFNLRVDPTGSLNALWSALPAAVIYFLYHPIIEVAMRGRTPGKLAARVALVDRNGGTPGTGAILIRNVFRLIDSLPVVYLIGLVSCFITENRVRIGDIAAGTILIVVDADARESLARVHALASASRLPLEAFELVEQLIERWPTLEEQQRARIARTLLARIAPATDQAALAAMAETELLRRLEALRDGRAPEEWPVG